MLPRSRTHLLQPPTTPTRPPFSSPQAVTQALSERSRQRLIIHLTESREAVTFLVGCDHSMGKGRHLGTDAGMLQLLGDAAFPLICCSISSCSFCFSYFVLLLVFRHVLIFYHVLQDYPHCKVILETSCQLKKTRLPTSIHARNAKGSVRATFWYQLSTD